MTRKNVLYGILLVAFGLAFAFYGGRTQKLVCYRTESNRADCRIESDFLGIVMGEIEIHDIRSAILQESGEYSQVLLVSSSGNIPLSNLSTADWADKQATVDQINDFIANPRHPGLLVWFLEGYYFLIGGGIGVFGGFAWMFGIKLNDIKLKRYRMRNN